MISNLEVKLISDGDSSVWELLSDFHYTREDPFNPNREYHVMVPKGFQTDFASVPRVGWIYAFAGNTAHKASLVHDYLRRETDVSPNFAHQVFLDIMEDTQTGKFRRKAMYWAVRLFDRGVRNGTERVSDESK